MEETVDIQMGILAEENLIVLRIAETAISMTPENATLVAESLIGLVNELNSNQVTH